MKTNLDSTFKTNKTYEQEGVDFVIRPEDKEKNIPETSFRVRRFNAQNPRVKAAMAAYYKPYARLIELGTLPDEKANEIAIRLFIDICLVSWTGVLDESNKPIECTKDNAYELFKSLPDLFATLQEHANNPASFKDEVGNS